MTTTRRLTEQANISTRQARIFSDLADHFTTELHKATDDATAEVLRAERSRARGIALELEEDARELRRQAIMAKAAR